MAEFLYDRVKRAILVTLAILFTTAWVTAVGSIIYIIIHFVKKFW